jgi:nitrate/nitrite transport system ATP-binding protein
MNATNTSEVSALVKPAIFAHASKATNRNQRYLEITGTGVVFDTKKGDFTALQNIDLCVAKGEFVTLIGHSGCGKSTLLNLIAGLNNPSSGTLLLDNREIKGPGPDRGVVFQNHSLLPWMSCLDNVLLAVERVFGSKNPGSTTSGGSETKAQLKARAVQALDMVGLSHSLDKRPLEISGGMKQRVGIARALAMEPKVLLMDEPFGALDALTRAHLQDELLKIVARTGSTVIMVTHDVDEAVLLSDRIVMLTNGPAATIGDIVHVDIERPRDRVSLANNSRYIECRQQVLEFLYRKQSHPVAN